MPNRKMVELAKEVLLQLNDGDIIADEDVYIAPHGLDCIEGDRLSLNDIVRNTTCTVCAIGGLLKVALEKDWLSHNLSRSRSLYSDQVYSLLETITSEEQLLLLEAAFEGVDMRENIDSKKTAFVTYKDLNQAIDFGYIYPNVSDRLEAIMLNIIRNEGEFIPS